LNKYSSKAQSQVARASIDAHIRDPTRGTKIVTAIAATPQPRAAYAGALPDSTINVPSLHQPLSEFSMDFQDEIQFQNDPHVETVRHDNQSTSVALHGSGKQKTDMFVIDEQNGGQQSKRKRAEKKCWKCGQTSCVGRGNKKNCTGQCQDCGLPHCDGRNSRHPSRSCATKFQGQS
jgi:hypothetical protein